MNNEDYDNYIRDMLGYPPINNIQNIESNNETNQSNQTMIPNVELERFYPEIYKIVYPMVQRKCNDCKMNLTNEEIEMMTDEIYNAIEVDYNRQNDIMPINTMQQNQVKTHKECERRTQTKAYEVKKEAQEIQETTKIKEDRQINRGLRDLIKILLLRELIGRPNPLPPPRPPFGPGPGPRPPVRPPFRPGPGPRPGGNTFNRENSDVFEDIYEK